ncbi:MAG: NUDIX hydrolase [Chloroflexota bacterium]
MQNATRGQAIRFDCTRCDRPLYENSRPCAGVVVVRDHRVLLAKRGIEPLKGYWDIPGGFLEAGEDPAAGAVRELLEETGLHIELHELLGMFVDRYGAGDHALFTLNIYFLADAPDGEPQPEDDVAELAWFGRYELPDALAFPHLRLVLQRWLEREPPA